MKIIQGSIKTGLVIRLKKNHPVYSFDVTFPESSIAFRDDDRVYYYIIVSSARLLFRHGGPARFPRSRVYWTLRPASA